MANAHNGNTLYIDSTGAIGPSKNVKVSHIFITGTGAAPRLVLQDGTTNKIDVRLMGTSQTGHLPFDPVPMYFPNGVTVSTITNCVATIVISQGGA